MTICPLPTCHFCPKSLNAVSNLGSPTTFPHITFQLLTSPGPSTQGGKADCVINEPRGIISPLRQQSDTNYEKRLRTSLSDNTLSLKLNIKMLKQPLITH